MRSANVIKYILKRLLMAVFVLLLVTVIVFVAVRLAPGDPVQAKIGPHGDYSPENVARVSAALGLDKPIYVQYLVWVRDCLKGSFGYSLINGADVGQLIAQKIPVSMELILVAMVLALLISIPLGVYSALKKGSVFDQVVSVISTGLLAVPTFCVGLLLLILISVKLRLLPSSGYVPFSENPGQNLKLLIMPALTLGLAEQASLTRYIRSETIEVLNSNYIRTARAKGLPVKVVNFKHAFKNVLVTVITLVGMRFAQLFGGTVIIEQLFGWSGLGWFTYQSIISRDYPAVQASVLLVAVIFVVVNMLVDILYAVIDPRIKLE
ncbi:MAG: ABC transporter permease [Lachnospiraceae bacterium]|nr:ABC transporter permease [Lachnospiraceae bacterium]